MEAMGNFDSVNSSINFESPRDTEEQFNVILWIPASRVCSADSDRWWYLRPRTHRKVLKSQWIGGTDRGVVLDERNKRLHDVRHQRPVICLRLHAHRSYSSHLQEAKYPRKSKITMLSLIQCADAAHVGWFREVRSGWPESVLSSNSDRSGPDPPFPPPSLYWLTLEEPGHIEKTSMRFLAFRISSDVLE